MSVIYKGIEHKVTLKGYLLTLDLSFRGIKAIPEIKGLENLTRLQVLNLSNNDISEIKGLDNLVNLISLNLFSCNISQIESFANKDKLKKLYLGKNPIYTNLKKVIANKNKLSKMTGGEREKAGVNPIVWEIAANSRFKLLKQPPRKNKTPMLSIIGEDELLSKFREKIKKDEDRIIFSL